MKPTLEVLAALAHVREHFPEVTMVVFNIEGLWQYMSDNFKQPVFDGSKIDVDILERAADSVEECPYIFQLQEKDLL